MTADTTIDTESWVAGNLSRLTDAIGTLRDRLRAGTDPEPAAPQALLDPPAAYERLRDGFGLSSFELAVVLLGAGIELDPVLADLVSAECGGRRPTFGFALRALPEPHWTAFTPAAPLRRWQLIEPSASDTHTSTAFRLSERTLHYLLGIDYVEPRLDGMAEQVELPDALPMSYRAQSGRLAALWDGGPMAVDGSASAVRSVTVAACAALGLGLLAVDASALAREREPRTLQRLWEREAMFGQHALLIEDDIGDDPAAVTAAQEFVRGLQCPVVVPQRLLPARRRVGRIVVDALSVPEQRALWQYALGPVATGMNGRMDEVVAQFPLEVDQFLDTVAQLDGPAAPVDGRAPDPIADRLWAQCRLRARAPMGRLAQRIESPADWSELVLPPEQLADLQQIAVHVRHRVRVNDSWGFGSRLRRGLGVSALFTGPSGTGKTLAAEVLANDLQLDLYRVDLSQLVSKYIGETEKNLAAVFDAAERGGSILLFDEADALFGKRSEVKDSHDRFANIEVSYLLQRMECYRGLAILTTNKRAALDQAFLRRLRFVVTFPFPESAERAAIWASIFPPSTPTTGLRVERLARLNVTGGTIRNIALHAAFLAAARDEPITMAHLLRAAQGECRKLEKPITAAEIGGWV